MAARILILVAGLLATTLCRAAPSTAVESLITDRLRLMQAVAAYKWQRNLPVEDLAREERVLQAAVHQGLVHGITVASSEAFFRAQIGAAKEVQNYWFKRWQQGETLPDAVPDLVNVVRPQLLTLGTALITELGRIQETGQLSDIATLTVKGLSQQSSKKISQALQEIDFYPDRFTQILDSDLLRVGTTGDYPPFSYRPQGESEYSGMDIEMARDLAQALGVKLLLVPTSWPDLTADLQAGKYDIAMSGVSRILPRQRLGFFSRPYHIGGKTAISRCTDAKRFSSLTKIDKPGVRVIVNPGGTNERFVDTQIKQASKLLHPDNRTIFARIISGEADVMVTDRIEAQLQAHKHPELCLPVASTLTYQQKAYLMQPDIRLKEFVDTWLELRLGEGLVAKRLSEFCSACALE
ncbi:gamma subclass chorismate mutase AroQ [Pseudomaricurvus alkylphenolicus]|uniref:gamma subclass chorismate mutase AroQ n=1 Tax=Pseudomaricurvus alkylphenolicus TaxID=1306991 RepID=UPI001421AAB7|nr:gamma subclass chorismate mutase AroQ [Pseudomaricurvus alkylphenolicus]NIB38793.1 gamma subclass chorismate mutase AroQ [Pseudomaricurvus alkylphenolicus]